MGRACSTHGEDEKLLVRSPKGRYHLDDLLVDKSIILKCILEKSVGR
jgi:hypothetical protein